MKRTSKKNTEISAENKNTGAGVKSADKNISSYAYIKFIFLALLFFYIITGLYQIMFDTAVLKYLQKVLLIPSAAIGIFALRYEKANVRNTINKHFNNKDKILKKDTHTIIFLIVIIVSAFALFGRLDYFDIFSDEVQTTAGAAGYCNTGEFRQWDFIKEKLVGKPYNRAKPHQIITALSFKIFGINTFAARFPSALSGIILIILLYLTGNFFIKDKTAALLATFAFALYFEFLFLGRWARMYAAVYPLFLLNFYSVFRFLNGSCRRNISENSFLKKYLDFDYPYLFVALILSFLLIYFHPNTTVIFPIFLVWLATAILLFPDEKKYLTAFAAASIILILQIIFGYKINFNYFTFFKVNNFEIYKKAFFGYPFTANISAIIIIPGISLIFLSENKSFKKKYSALLTATLLPFVLFSYIIEYAPSYRYVSFITPLSVLLITGTYMLIAKILFNKFLRILLITVLSAFVITSFALHYDNLYVKNSYSPAKPGTAYKTIVKNFHKGDVILKHWGPKRYLKGIPEDTKFISLGTYKGKDFAEMYKIINENHHGWITWHKYNENRLDPDFVTYCNLYFKKYAGYGIDDYGEEIFYFDNDMIKPLNLFAFQKYLPVAGLCLKNPYSFVFDLKINDKTNGSPFFLKKDENIFIDCFIEDKKLVFKIPGTENIKITVPENKINRIIWTLAPGKTQIFVNGKKAAEKNIRTDSALVKFIVNPAFGAYIDNIKLYNFILDKDQIKAVTADTENSEQLTAGNKKFGTIFLWKKK